MNAGTSNLVQKIRTLASTYQKNMSNITLQNSNTRALHDLKPETPTRLHPPVGPNVTAAVRAVNEVQEKHTCPAAIVLPNLFRLRPTIVLTASRLPAKKDPRTGRLFVFF